MADTRRASLTRRVPVFLTLILGVALGGATLVGYFQLRALLLEQNEERLSVTTTLLAQLLGTQLNDGLGVVEARADSLAPLLAGEDLAPAIGPRLRTWAQITEQSRGVWVRLGERCLGAVGPSGEELVERCPDLLGAGPEPPGIGPIFAVGDEARYRAVAPVAAGGVTAYLVVESALVADAARLVSNLVAPDAQLLLGMEGGDVWTDLVTTVDADIPVAGTSDDLRFTLADETRVATVDAIPGTPWVALIHRNESVVLSPSRTFLWWMGGGSLAIMLLSSAFAGVLSLRVTRPLAAVTHGAEAIARGDYHQQVEVHGSDEVARLGAAFNEMARRVEEHRDILEAEVKRRTADLRKALDDLTEAQEELLRKERLATLGQLAGGVGHELRNPLGVMTNALFYLESVMDDPPAKVREYFGILREQITTSEKIVTDLLDFARIKTPEREDVEVRDLFVAGLDASEVPASIVVTLEVPEPCPRVHVDARQVVQILHNLVTNAAQAMETAGGKLTLSAEADTDTVVLRVEDTGPGIDADRVEKIFEPLVTSKARGIGLGLAVSRTLAAQNGGSLAVKSQVGVGSTFELALPAAQGDAPS